MLSFLFIFVLIAVAPDFSVGKPEPSNSLINTRIIGGGRKEIEDLPYQLAVYQYGSFVCGGAIISPYHAVTTATCVQNYNYNNYELHSGSSEILDGYRKHAIKAVHFHPFFNRGYYYFNVAVLELVKPFKFDSITQPIQVTDYEPSVGSLSSISGWGATSENSATTNYLMVARVPIVDRTVCAGPYTGTHNVTKDMICAGGQGTDFCTRDEGGPLVNGNTLVGLASWGTGCGRSGVPKVYTNLAHPKIQHFLSVFIEKCVKVC